MARDTILFDINETVLDLAALRPKFASAFGDEAVTATWFSMLLQSSTVCAITGVRTTFADLAAAMLDRVAALQGRALADVVRSDILSGFAGMPAHADVAPALRRLAAAGYRRVAFTNSSRDLVNRQLATSGLAHLFDEVISVEEAGSFKPDPAVYAFAASKLARAPEDLRLVACHDWDTHGALSAGFLAAHIARNAAPYHPLYHRPDVEAADMAAVVEGIFAADAR